MWEPQLTAHASELQVTTCDLQPASEVVGEGESLAGLSPSLVGSDVNPMKTVSESN